ncbi:MAG: hypothetical protein HYZ42_13540, partial [Bacteroidetes bacterium]|nr:hypothetical protein [Bacteroidota bacterium]
MAVNTYPYQNRSLADIKGEIWDDVPGYEGEYQVSNLGRIKSLRRWKNSGTQSGYYTTEMIRKSIVRLDYNAHIKKNNYLISITLKSGGICHTTAIARYVYYVFVKPFDIDNPGNIVSYKDHDGRNVKPENLYLTTRKKLTKLSHQLGRSYSSWYENKIPVVQFDISSRVVATFSSITEAAQAVGGNTGAIVSCTKGHIYQHKGFRWRVVSKKSSERKKSEA